MSRVGKVPIEIPDGVELLQKGNTVIVKGAKGELSKTFDPRITISVENGSATVTRASDEKEVRALHGLTRALLFNMVHGVSSGYEKTLQLIGVGYSVEPKGKNVLLNLGYSHPILFESPEGIEFEIQKPEAHEKAEFRNMQSKVVIRGIDKQLVGQVSADIKSLRPPEPYKGKGFRFVGEYVRKKAGKQVATAITA